MSHMNSTGVPEHEFLVAPHHNGVHPALRSRWAGMNTSDTLELFQVTVEVLLATQWGIHLRKGAGATLSDAVASTRKAAHARCGIRTVAVVPIH